MNNPSPEKRNYPETNLYITEEEKDLIEQTAIQLSARIGRQVTLSELACYTLRHFQTLAMFAMINEYQEKRG